MIQNILYRRKFVNMEGTSPDATSAGDMRGPDRASVNMEGSAENAGTEDDYGDIVVEYGYDLVSLDGLKLTFPCNGLDIS